MSENSLNAKDILKYTASFGFINKDKSQSFDDLEENDLGKEKLLKYKIINIKIYLVEQEQKEIIVGLEYTFRNLYNGKEIIKKRKNENEITNFKQFKINNGEYLTNFHVRFNSTKEYITQLCFNTNNGNNIIVGTEEGELKNNILRIEEKNIIIGFYGAIGDQLNSIGCYYTTHFKYAFSILYKFFMLRHLVKINNNFKKEWDESYEKLPIEYKFIWKTINMPDNTFVKIIQKCI